MVRNSSATIYARSHFFHLCTGGYPFSRIFFSRLQSCRVSRPFPDLFCRTVYVLFFFFIVFIIVSCPSILFLFFPFLSLFLFFSFALVLFVSVSHSTLSVCTSNFLLSQFSLLSRERFRCLYLGYICISWIMTMTRSLIDQLICDSQRNQYMQGNT